MVLLRFSKAPAGTTDRDFVAGNRYAAETGRSWWGVRYMNGLVIHEWERDPRYADPSTGHADWIRIPKERLQSVRLYCPNQKGVQLGSTVDATGTLFQLKRAIAGLSFRDGLTSVTKAHVIGIIDQPDGSCLCFRWEPWPAPVPDVFDASRPGDAFRAWSEYEAAMRRWREAGCGVGPIEWRDNVFDMQYDHIGPLSADNLSLVAGEGR